MFGTVILSYCCLAAEAKLARLSAAQSDLVKQAVHCVDSEVCAFSAETTPSIAVL